MTVADFLKKVKGNYLPVYIIHGTEPYFIDQAVHHFEKEILNDAEKEFNLTVCYGRDSLMENILSSARRYPMMAEKQVIIVKEAQDLPDWKRMEEVESFGKYVTKPVDSTILVFAFKHKKPDGRLKAMQQVKKSGAMFEFNAYKDYQLPGWISDYVKQKGYNIEQNASLLLAEYLGTDLKKMVNELEKMMITLPEGTKFNTAHIEANVGISKDYNIFEFQNALGSKNIEKSNRIVSYFNANPKEHPLAMVVPYLYGYFTKVMMYQTLDDRSDTGAARSLRVAPFAVKNYATASKNFKPRKLERIIGYIRETDARSKGQRNKSVGNDFLLKEMVFKILH
jgi:DNA polymerase III subunit delta